MKRTISESSLRFKVFFFHSIEFSEKRILLIGVLFLLSVLMNENETTYIYFRSRY